ncbi:2OG-Fe(II) oxygenase [bacterium]|nr:2OG-Fe(II) oxygenase [Candidatus Elulimicrobium humile]
MNLTNHYWYFQSVLTPRFCDEVIKYGTAHEEQLALTGGFDRKDPRKLNEEELRDLKKKRDSNIAWLNDTWIYREIHPYIHEANKQAGWNFDWDFSESCQFTKYKLNQYYDWHCDSWDKVYDKPDDPNSHGKIRKLSVTCSLSNPEDYVGGELEFDFRNNDPDKQQTIRTCTEILPRGSICVFPSFVWHRVKPVVKGTRYSLVIWNLGYPYR